MRTSPKAMSDDPWRDIPPAPNADLLSARRVDPAMPAAFFWGKGVDRRCLLLLQHRSEASLGARLPRLKGIELVLSGADTHGNAVLVLRLLETEQRELFFRLCQDIVAFAGQASNEKEAVARTLARTWRWHHLLRGGGDNRLSPEEQKGLIGELLVLRRILNDLSPHDAVQAWRGPLGAPKDFEIGRLSIEAKARRGPAAPYVAVSSEHQLDPSGVDVLLLCVHELDEAPADNPTGESLSEIARGLHALIADVDPGAGALFDSLLASAGFRWDDDYSDTKWVHGRDLMYRVRSGFPSVTPACFPTGVRDVRYTVSLPECEPFRVPSDSLSPLLRQRSNGG